MNNHQPTPANGPSKGDILIVDYITKPFQIAEVLVRVRNHLTIRNLQRQLQQANLELRQTNTELLAANTALPEDQKNLFTEFTRLDKVYTEGHGLGLSTVRRIIEKLGGEAGVESKGVPGEGSLFYFTLPSVTD